MVLYFLNKKDNDIHTTNWFINLLYDWKTFYTLLSLTIILTFISDFIKELKRPNITEQKESLDIKERLNTKQEESLDINKLNEESSLTMTEIKELTKAK